MAQQIMKSTAFQPSAMTFSKFRKNKRGGGTVYINGPENKKKYIQLPYMRAPFGVSTFTDDATGNTSYSLNLSFDSNDPELCEFQTKMEEFDDLICDMVAKNSKEWLGKQYNIAVIKEALYKPMVTQGKTVGDTTYSPTMKLKVLYNKAKDEFDSEAYNSARERIPVDSIEKSQKVMTIIDINQIWFIDNKFGVSMRFQQGIVEESQKLPSFAFQGLDEAEEEEDEVDFE